MPRIARIVIPSLPHHVTQRGNHRQEMFYQKEDFEFFLYELEKYSRKYGLRILSYCLMSNHTHLAVVPESKESLGNALKPLHMKYSQYINSKMGRSGVNWQGRFFSSPMDEQHTWIALQYIALNPVTAGIVQKVEQYRWSSAAAHLLKKSDPILNAPEQLQTMATRSLEEISSREVQREDLDKFEMIRRNLKKNLPVGSDDFITHLEKETGRVLRYRPRGRPSMNCSA